MAASADADRSDRFVEAQRGAQGPGQLGVADQVVVPERLLDAEQVEGVQGGEGPAGGTGIAAIAVDLEGEGPEVGADSGDRLDVPSRVDLQLDPPVALGHPLADRSDQGLHRVGHANRDAGHHLATGRPQAGGQGLVEGLAFGIEHGKLEGRLGHPVPLHPTEQRTHVGRREGAPGGQEARQQVASQDIHRPFGVLGAVTRIAHGHALAPTLGALVVETDQPDIALGDRPEGRAPRLDERQAHPTQLDAPQPAQECP